MFINYRERKIDIPDYLEDKHENHFGYKISEVDIDDCICHIYKIDPDNNPEALAKLSDKDIIDSVVRWLGGEIEWLEKSAQTEPLVIDPDEKE